MISLAASLGCSGGDIDKKDKEEKVVQKEREMSPRDHHCLDGPTLLSLSPRILIPFIFNISFWICRQLLFQDACVSPL